MKKIGFVLISFILSSVFSFLYSLLGTIIIFLQAPQDPMNGYSGFGFGLAAVFYFLISFPINLITFFVGTLVEKKNNPNSGYFPDYKIHVFLAIGNLIVAFLPLIF